MTQEEKLEKAKELYPTANADQRYVLECLFPELKESEDERIRKGILEHIQLCTESIPDRDKYIAWLEKQGESYTKRDVDNAFVEGMALAKDELEKQSEQKPQRMISAEAKEALYDKPAIININKMVDSYASTKERGNEEFGLPLNCMIRAYRQGICDTLEKLGEEIDLNNIKIRVL